MTVSPLFRVWFWQCVPENVRAVSADLLAFCSVDALRFIPNVALLLLTAWRSKDRERGLNRHLRWFFGHGFRLHIWPPNPLAEVRNPVPFSPRAGENRWPELTSFRSLSTW